jgi:glycosyltransferase involved in cell wall biosynthesis
MKVTVVSHSYQDRENQKNIDELAKLMDIQVILQEKFSNWLIQLKDFRNNNPMIYKYYKSFYIWSWQYIFLNLNLGLKQFKPDIILIEYNPWSVTFMQVVICKYLQLSKARIVCFIKKNTFIKRPGIFGKIKWIVARYSIKIPEHFFASSQMVADLLINTFSIPRNRISIVNHLGVDTALFSPTSDIHRQDFVNIGYVGRLEEYKGVLDLVEATRIVHEKNDSILEIRLSLLGDGKLFSILNNLRTEMPWINIYPPCGINEVPKFLETVDIFVLPSRILEDHQEHDAHALMEAMSSGIASIGCRSGVIPELLSSGAGILVDPECPEQIAEAILRLLNNKDLRYEYQKEAREKALAEFSNAEIARKKVKMLQALL